MKIGLALGACAVLSFGVGFGAGTIIKSPRQVLAETEPPPKTDLTAPITTGTISQSVLFPATITNGNSIDAGANSGFEGFGAGIITRAPVPVGTKVGPGTVLFEDSDRPVILLPGEVPMFRDLKNGDSGADVARLQASLGESGFMIFDEPGIFGPSTELALLELYQQLGYEVAVTGPEPSAPAPSGPATTGEEARPVITARAAELAFAPHGAVGRITAVNAKLGDPVPGSAVVSLTTAPPNITLTLTQAEAGQIGYDSTVEVTGASLEKPLAATVSQIDLPVAGEEGEDPTVKVLLTPAETLPPESVSSRVQLAFSPPGEAETGLLVPLAAISSTPNGDSAITLVEGKKKRKTQVQIVRSGDGLAQITSDETAVAEGAQVLVGSS